MFDFFKKPEAPVQQQATPVVKEEPPINPLDTYQEMFKKAAETPDNEDIPPFALDDKIVDEVTGKLNFLDPELLAQAKEGNTEALIALINRSNQKAYRAALQHAVALTNTHLKTRDDAYQKSLGKGVKQSLVKQAITEVPNASHPLVRSELERIAGNIAKENPDLPPAEIANQAKKYFNEIHRAMSGPPVQQEQKKQVSLKDFLGV